MRSFQKAVKYLYSLYNYYKQDTISIILNIEKNETNWVSWKKTKKWTVDYNFGCNF